jgi:hypothetical protein
MSQVASSEHHWTLKTVDGKKTLAICTKCGYIRRDALQILICRGWVNEI